MRDARGRHNPPLARIARSFVSWCHLSRCLRNARSAAPVFICAPSRHHSIHAIHPLSSIVHCAFTTQPCTLCLPARFLVQSGLAAA